MVLHFHGGNMDLQVFMQTVVATIEDNHKKQLQQDSKFNLLGKVAALTVLNYSKLSIEQEFLLNEQLPGYLQEDAQLTRIFVGQVPAGVNVVVRVGGNIHPIILVFFYNQNTGSKIVTHLNRILGTKDANVAVKFLNEAKKQLTTQELGKLLMLLNIQLPPSGSSFM